SRGVASRAVSPESTLDHVLPVGDRCEFGLEGWRLVARGIVRAAIPRREFEQLAACGLLTGAGFGYDLLQNLAVTAGSDGQPMLVIPGGEAALRCIISKLDVAAFQRLAVGRSKNWDQDAAPRVRGQGLPIDIERSSAGRLRSPFQDVEPPRIVGIVNAHVVRHEIENEPNVRRIERSGQAPKRILAAELRVERIVVDHVISVRAARARLEERGSIEMADAKGLEIRHQRGRSVEAEIRGELETVSRERDGGRHHPSPMLQNTDHGGSFVGGSPPQIGRSGRKLRGSSAPSSARLGSILSILPWASTQVAVRIRCSHCAAPNFAPASCGTISRRRVVRRSRTSASRLRPSNVVRASQSSTAERKVASSSGSGTSSPNSAYGDLNSSRRPLRT